MRRNEGPKWNNVTCRKNVVVENSFKEYKNDPFSYFHDTFSNFHDPFSYFHDPFSYFHDIFQFQDDVNIYKSNLYYIVFDPLRPYLVLKHEWTFMVECDVNANEITSSHVEHLPEIHNASFSSHYHLSMSYFSDVNFLHRISGNPLMVHLGDNVFVKVFTTLPDWDTKMILDTCYTRPSSVNTTTMDVALIKDG